MMSIRPLWMYMCLVQRSLLQRTAVSGSTTTAHSVFSGSFQDFIPYEQQLGHMSIITYCLPAKCHIRRMSAASAGKRPRWRGFQGSREAQNLSWVATKYISLNQHSVGCLGHLYVPLAILREFVAVSWGGTFRTRGLFSKHLTVATCPLKRRFPP